MKHISLFFVIIALFLGVSGFANDRPWIVLNKFGQELAKKHGLKVLNTGTGSLIDDCRATWCVNFISSQCLSINEAEVLANSIAKALLEKMHADPIFAHYSRKYKTPLRTSSMSFKITFWDKDFNRPPEPYIAQITWGNEKFSFYVSDKNQFLTQLIVEKSNESAIVESAQN